MEETNTTFINATLATENITDGCGQICISDQDLEIIKTWKYWLEGVIMVFLAIPGLLATSISIYLLTRNNRNKMFSQLLTALAVYDLIYLVIMSFESLGFLFVETGLCSFELWWYIRGFLTPYFLLPVKYMSMTGSIYMMMALAVERYIAVCKPFQRIPTLAQHGQASRSRGRKLAKYILLVTFFSIAFNATKFVETRYIEELPYIQIRLAKNPTYIIIFAVLRLMFIAVIPLLVVSILNYKIYKTVRKSSSRSKDDQTLLIVLTLIVVIFILCSVPRIILVMYEVAIIKTIRKCSHLNNKIFPVWWQILKFISHNLLVLNPLLNLLVYMSFGKSFRRATKKYSTTSILGTVRSGQDSLMSFLQRSKSKATIRRTKKVITCNGENIDNIDGFDNEDTNQELVANHIGPKNTVIQVKIELEDLTFENNTHSNCSKANETLI